MVRVQIELCRAAQGLLLVELRDTCLVRCLGWSEGWTGGVVSTSTAWTL